VSRRASRRRSEDPAGGDLDGEDTATRWCLPAALLSGALAFVSQQLLLRELYVSLVENPLLAGLALAGWLVMAGLGCLLPRARTGAGAGAGESPADEPAVLRVLCAQAAACPLALLVARALVRGRQELFLAQLVPGRATLPELALISTVVLAPCAWTAGLAFRRLAAGRSEALARRVLAFDSAGAALGIPFLHTGRAWAVPPAAVAAVAAMTALAWATYRRARGGSGSGAGARSRVVGALAPGAGLLAAVLALCAAGEIEQTSIRWTWHPFRVEMTLDTPLSRVSLLHWSREGLTFWVNRFPMYSTAGDAEHNEGLVHLPLLLHPDPRRVLLVGGGVGGNAREVLKHPVDEVVLCELEPVVLAAGRTIFAEATGRALDDPRVVPLAIDGARFLAVEPGQFDAILLDLPDPYSPQLARFYSLDFLRRARRKLKPGGLLCIQLPPATGPLSEVAPANRVLARTFREAFPQTVALFAKMDYLIGFEGRAPDPRSILARSLSRRLARRALDDDALRRAVDDDARRSRLGYLDAAPQRQPEAASAPAGHACGPAGVPLSTDDRPAALAYDMYVWTAIGHRGSARLVLWLGEASPLGLAGLLALSAALLVAALRGASGSQGPALAGLAGMAAMALSVLTLYQVQVRTGALALLTPALSGAFLVGHAGGALLLVGRHAGPRTWLAALAVVVPATPYAIGAPADPALAPWTAALALAAGGWATGALFPALLRSGGERAAWIYAADLVGAGLAAFLITPVALPLLGVRSTGLVLAAVLALAAAALRVTPLTCRTS
jgi:spermidine synthase